MLQHSFSDFSYAVNAESKKRKHKEVLVCYIYNGVEVLKKVYIPEKPGTAYVFEAKKIIDQEMRDGSLAVYSHKFIFKNRKKGIQPKKIVAAVAKGEKESSVPLAPTLKTSNDDAKNKPESHGTTPKSSNNNKKWLIVGGCVVVVGLVLGAIFTTKAILESKIPNYYKVNFAGTGCNYAGETKVTKGVDEYACTITAKDNKQSPFISSITMGDDLLAAGVDYTFDPSVTSENNLKITKKIQGDIIISAAVETTTFDVNLVPIGGVEFVDAPTTSKKGEKYNCKVECTEVDNALDIVSVTMGGRTLTEGTASSGDYYYYDEEKRLIFNTPTDNDINITIGTKVTQYKVNYHLSGCQLVESPETVPVGEQSYWQFVDPSPRKILVTAVSMGGDNLTLGQQWYFSESDRLLSVYEPAHGNIVISAVSYDPAADSFTIKTTGGDGCKTVADVTGITPGDSRTVKLEVVDPINKKVRITAVVMGGVSLKINDGYTFNPSSGELTIPRVTDNVSINFEAVDIGEVIATPVYEPSEDGSHYVVKSFTLPAGKTTSDIESITIDSEYAPDSNAEPLPVTEIEKGALNEFIHLQELSIPFIGAKYLEPGEETPMDGSQLFGHIFGDTPHAGTSATWQYYYDAEGVQHPRKFIIPNTLRYITITGDNTVVPAGAFSGCRSIINIEFKSNTVSTIQNSAFQNCESLRDITIPSGVTMIQDCAFQNCTGLQHLDLPLGLTTIGRYAFNGCTGFSRIYLNDSITIVGEAAFSNVRYGVIACSKTKTIVENIETWNKNWVDATTTVIYGAIDINDYISTTNFHYMLVKNDDGETGAFVAEYLGDSAASEITIPYSVDNKDAINEESYPIFGLGNNMFSEYIVTTKFKFECTDLTSIGSYCFAYCYALDNLEGFDNLTKLKDIGSYAFGACTSLTSINVPSSVSSIGEYAFAYDKVTTFDLSGCTNLKSLDTGVFYYCYETTSIILPEGLTYLGENIFEGCYKLTSLTLNTSGVDTIPYALLYCADDLEHPERVSQLTTFTWVSDTPLKTIGGSAFGGCGKLTSVTFGSATANHIPSTVGTIGDYAFTRCTGITNIYINHGTQEGDVSNIDMGLEVFKGWTANQRLHLPTAYVNGGGLFSTEATTPWGWNLSRGMLEWGQFTCSKSGSVDLIITTN